MLAVLSNTTEGFLFLLERGTSRALVCTTHSGFQQAMLLKGKVNWCMKVTHSPLGMRDCVLPSHLLVTDLKHLHLHCFEGPNWLATTISSFFTHQHAHTHTHTEQQARTREFYALSCAHNINSWVPYNRKRNKEPPFSREIAATCASAAQGAE